MIVVVVAAAAAAAVLGVLARLKAEHAAQSFRLFAFHSVCVHDTHSLTDLLLVMVMVMVVFVVVAFVVFVVVVFVVFVVDHSASEGRACRPNHSLQSFPSLDSRSFVRSTVCVCVCVCVCACVRWDVVLVHDTD